MLHTVVNNQGQISATDIEGQGGSIELVATGGNLETQATLEASGALGGGGIELSSDNDILIGDPRPDSGEVLAFVPKAGESDAPTLELANFYAPAAEQEPKRDVEGKNRS